MKVLKHDIDVQGPLATPLSASAESIRKIKVDMAAAFGPVVRKMEIPRRIQALKEMEAERAARWAWTAGIAIIMLNIALVFSPMFVSKASTTPSGAAGPQTQQFIAELGNAGLSATAVRGVKKPGISAKGTLVALGGDNLQAFEYGDAGTAAKEAAALASAYADPGTDNSNPLESHISLYQRDDLLVIYVGSRANILQALGTVLGKPLLGGQALSAPAMPAASSSAAPAARSTVR